MDTSSLKGSLHIETLEPPLIISIDELTATLASIFEDHGCEELTNALGKNNNDLDATIDYLINQSTPKKPISKSNITRRRSSPEGQSSTNKKLKSRSSLVSWLCPEEDAVKCPINDSAEPRKKNQNVDSSSSVEPSTQPSNRVSLQREPTTLRSLNEVLGRTSERSPSKPAKRPNLAPLFLSTPQQISQHLSCCSLLHDILPKDLAFNLYLKMINDCNGLGETKQAWTRNRWWLADRQVQSPHLTAFFIAKSSPTTDSLIQDYNETAQFWFVGKPLEADARTRFFLEEMNEAKIIVESIVNKLLNNDPELLLRAQRDITSNPIKRFDQEWDGPWKANVAASNCYRGSKENIGWHADQLTYIGPYPTIASLSLGTTRQFRLRPVAKIQEKEDKAGSLRTYSMSLPHNSLLVMHGGCQEGFKHSIPPQIAQDRFHNPRNSNDSFVERINITFRFYRPDFSPSRSILPSASSSDLIQSITSKQLNSSSSSSSTTPKCHCGIPAILRADQKGKVAASLLSTLNHLPEQPDFLFFWHCQAGQQNSGKSCKFFKVLDFFRENRGPCIGDRIKKLSLSSS